MVLWKLNIHIKRMKADSYITQKHTKKLCTYIKSLNVRYMTITPLEENIKKKLFDMISLEIIPKA